MNISRILQKLFLRIVSDSGMESFEMVDSGDTVTEDPESNHVADKEKDEQDTFIVKDNNADDDEGRDIWPRKIEYFLSVIGYIIGFGTIWRFPYMAMRNGGGRCIIV